MIKIIIFQILTILGVMIAVNPTTQDVIQWGDIGIVEQVRIIAGLTLMICVAVAAIVLFRSVWVKEGYAGLDKILVDKEVSLFMSHVLAFILLEVFIFLIIFINYVQPPQYVFYICGAGFLSPEAMQVMHFIMDRIKSIKRKE